MDGKVEFEFRPLFSISFLYIHYRKTGANGTKVKNLSY